MVVDQLPGQLHMHVGFLPSDRKDAEHDLFRLFTGMLCFCWQKQPQSGMLKACRVSHTCALNASASLFMYHPTRAAVSYLDGTSRLIELDRAVVKPRSVARPGHATTHGDVACSAWTLARTHKRDSASTSSYTNTLSARHAAHITSSTQRIVHDTLTAAEFSGVLKDATALGQGFLQPTVLQICGTLRLPCRTCVCSADMCKAAPASSIRLLTYRERSPTQHQGQAPLLGSRTGSQPRPAWWSYRCECNDGARHAARMAPDTRRRA